MMEDTLAPDAEQMARFWAKVDDTGHCWVWTASKFANGYGRFSVKRNCKRKTHLAHRVAFASIHGPIAEGLQIDHTCYNRACVNPDHLRAVTHKQNMENRSGVQRSSRTGIRGVRHYSTKKWMGYARHNRVEYTVGPFDQIAEAEAAVIELRCKLFTHNDIDRGLMDTAVTA